MTACSCRPCGIRCDARRRSQADSGDARASPNDRQPEVVSTGAIAGRNQWYAGRLLSTLDILRATWLAGFGTLPWGQVAEASSGRNPRPLLMWSGHVRVRPGAYSTPERPSASAQRRSAAPRAPQRCDLALRVCRWLTPPYVRSYWVVSDSGSSVPPAGAVIGGQTAPAGAWPFAAALIDASTSDTLAGEMCGAVVVGPREALTAAHCVTVDGSAHPRKRALDVVAGRLRLKGAGPARVHVVSVRIHPGFDPGTLANDLALLELARPVAGAAQLDDGSAGVVGSAAIALGWGSTTAAAAGEFPDAHAPDRARRRARLRLLAGLRRRSTIRRPCCAPESPRAAATPARAIPAGRSSRALRAAAS